MNPVVMALVLVVGFAAFAFSARRRWRLLRVGAPAGPIGRPGARLAAVVKFAFGQWRMPRYRGAGVAHILIFGGFLVLLLRTLVLWGRGFDEGFGLGLLGSGQPLGQAYGLLKDIVTIGVLIGVAVFAYYRLVKRLPRLTLSGEGLLILGIIFTMMAADVVYDGASLLHAGATLSPWQPGGSLAAMAFDWIDCSAETVNALRHVGFWTHALLVLLFLNILPYSKHFHVITAIPNVYLQSLDPAGRLRPITDLEGRAERGEPLGIARIEQFSWKALLDFYTCTECGRCTDHCPAAATGKLLSPKQLCVDLRDHLYSRQVELIAASAGRRSPPAVDLAGAVVKPEAVWACTTCRACEQECPVFISQVDKIVDLRRYLVQEKGEFPPQLATAFRGLEQSGNPWNLPAAKRTEWTAGLDVPRLADHLDAAWLLWVGCAPAFDERAGRIARATAQLLQRAGVSFAIIGGNEQCTGDPARRAGNEFLFQTLARANIELFSDLGVRKIITICPHCFNTLHHEYPDFGGRYKVVHHTELLAGLLADGRLAPVRPVEAPVVYHDACYLGRYNNIYAAPRRVLTAIPGVRLIEAPQNGDRGLCCGGGGAQFFKDEEPGRQRVSYGRIDQLLATSAGVISSACPFCMRMLTDGLAARNREDVRQLDVAEVLWEAVGG